MSGSTIFFVPTADSYVVIAAINKILPRKYYLKIDEADNEDLREVWSKESVIPVQLPSALREEISRITGVQTIVP